MTKAVQYHERITDIQQARDHIKEQIEKNVLNTVELEGNDQDNHPVECVPVETIEMISELNLDQKRIFDKVTKSLTSNNDILRLYIMGKDTAVTAPTGIAAFNIEGLTIHRLFQLPVEHGHTAQYRQLSDAALQIVRDQLKNVALVIIDEISMVSNVTFLYIHLRLAEIFDTTDSGDGWFGKKPMLLFGDLLQLPPVHEEPAFIQLSNKVMEKNVGGLGSYNLWSALFSYDELTINMRQQGDNVYKDILSRIRTGVVINSDTKELCDYMLHVGSNTVCLLPTCVQCDVLNTAMLSRFPSEEIHLIAQDTMNCAPYLKKKVSKVLNNNDDDSSRTAGLSRIIIVKVGVQIMIRRNIDVTLGLVNGTIAKLVSVTRGVDNDVEKLKIILPTRQEHIIEPVSVKFVNYGLTIHKSQGLSLQNAVIEASNSIFTCGQIYVALSRMTTLQGLHLINYDPSSVKAQESAIIEYNRLRTKYRPDLMTISISKNRVRNVRDAVWAVPNYNDVSECQSTNDYTVDNTQYYVRGLPNSD
ncbi:ATP-dependent DNA helicase PIF1-like, partial [Hylaeus anthracinus]|uniref:ATP-dependent DNA helicase PIF1-like n=1 Tax=Hylaeus anthracinus TaxID=313031 RepID=UPI0023B8C11C